MGRQFHVFRRPLWTLGIIMMATANACAPTMAKDSGTGSLEAAQQSVSSPVEIHIVAREFKIEPHSLQVPIGRPVHVIFDNKGVIEHNVQAAGTSLHLQAPAGQTARGEFTFDKAGTY